MSQFLTFLIVDVLLDHLVRDVAAGDGEIASCPEVASPEGLADGGEEGEELVGAFPFEALHEVGNGEVRRVGGEEVDMIDRHFPRDDLDVLLLADLTDEIPDFFPHLPVEHLLTVLGDPDEVDLEVVLAVGSGAVVPHGQKAAYGSRGTGAVKLKSPPKGGGFSPIPRWGQ